MQKRILTWQKRDDLFLVPSGGWVLAAVVLLSVFLAGGQPIWAQGVLTVGIGVLWLVWPPTKLPDKPVMIILLVLAILPLAAYLPGTWLAMPDWRRGLLQYPAISASGFITPQPWFTFHVWLLWLCGLGLAAWCACREWSHYNRGTLARIYAGGMLVITLIAIFGHATGIQPPWWHNKFDLGPFLNRNQWGSSLGFAGIVSIALVHQCLRQKHYRGVLFWACATAIFAWAILQNGSRGGVVVFVAGGFAYWSFFGVLNNHYHYAVLAISFLFISFAIFAISGGDLLERFFGLTTLLESGGGRDARIEFYRMTAALVRDAPFAGFGLGSFEYVFPFYLDYEPMFDRRPLHPESSWLWLLSEGGWLLTIAVIAGLAVLVTEGYISRRSRAATMRAAGLSCALMLAVNSIFEVSGHRIGVLFPVIMLASLALPVVKNIDAPWFLNPILRAVGVLFASLGFLWILAGVGVPFLPKAQGIAALQERAGSERAAGHSELAINLLDKGKTLRPLDWGIHWALSDWQLQEGRIDSAWKEFQAANVLLPYLYWTIEQQAEKWIALSPTHAADAILETIKRAPEAKRMKIYSRFLQKSTGNLVLRSALLRIFPDDPVYEFVRIQHTSPGAVVQRLERFIKSTQNLTLIPETLVEPVLRFMLEQGQTDMLDRIVTANPRLKVSGWEVLVEREAQAKHYKEALDLYFNYGPRPALPAPLSRSDLRSVERAAALAPLDIATAIAYYQALVAARRDGDAFWQLHRIMDSPLAPPYIWFLAAQTAYHRGEYEDAWNHLSTFMKKPKP